MIKTIFVLGLFVAVSQRSFVSTVPIPDAEERENEVKGEKSVEELENLKHSLGRTLSMMRTQTDMYRDLNGKKEVHTTNAEEIKQNGQLVAKLFQRMDTDPEAPDKGGQQTRARVRTELEVPSEVLHHVEGRQLQVERKRQSKNQDPQNNDDRSSSSSSEATQQYTPLEMAEYVFWTGDEKSVSLAVEEFLQEGMMTREEAIVFLQEIKYDLDYLNDHYSRYGPNFNEHYQDSVKERNQREGYQNSKKPETQQKRTTSEQIKKELNHLKQLQETHKRKVDAVTLYLDRSNLDKKSIIDAENSNKENYRELLERLRLADFLYTEYSLEEVIYQLAKVIFIQSFGSGSLDAQNALSKFMNFLEKEAEEGRISRSLEKKVLDVLVAALSDTINEHPELLDLRQEMLQGNEKVVASHEVLKQILEYPLEERSRPQMNSFVNPEKEKSSQLNNMAQMKDKKMLLHIPYAIGRK